MQGISGIAAPSWGVRPAVRAAWRGLIGMLLRADSPPAESWRSPWQRRTIVLVDAGAALLLCAASLASLTGGPTWAGPCVTVKTSLTPPVNVHPAATVHRTANTHQSSNLVRCLDPHSVLGIIGGPQNLWALVAAGVVVVPLALAVRYPLLAWRIGWLGLLLVPLADLSWRGGLPWGPAQVLVLLAAACMAGIRHERAVLGWLCGLSLVPWWFWIVWRGLDVVTAALGSVAFLAVAVAVDRVGSGHRARRDLAELAEQTELERARRIALEERAKIARELHDVVAHHMSLMAIRAESAPHRLGPLAEPVHAEFSALSGSAREALADMRRLLGVLRSDQPTERAPQPGLRDLPELIDSARQAGMAVDLSAPPTLGQVPPGAGVCAYRIVQEALSNARRHAPGAPVAVSVEHSAGAVTLEVTSGPGLLPAVARANDHSANGHGANSHPPGHGLAGMRERAELLGGSFSAGPAPDGGFAVCAVLPLNGSTA